MQILRRLLLILLLLGLLVVGWTFASVNETGVEVDLLLGPPVPASLWLALVVAFAAGAALATAVCLFEVARYGLVARRYRKTVARLESEIHQLRNLPLADEESPVAARGAREADFPAPPGGPAPSRG